MGKQEELSDKLSEQIKLFISKLRADGIDEVTLDTVEKFWLPKIIELENKVEGDAGNE